MDYGELVFEVRVRGLTQDQYMNWMHRQASIDTSGMAAEAAEKVEFTKLNLHRTGRIGQGPVTGHAIREIIRRRADEAGYTPAQIQRLGGHSLRAGFVTEAFRQGADAHPASS